MKPVNRKHYCLTIALIGLGIMSIVGCRPSIHEVIKVISKVPLGTNRSEVWKALVKAYPKDVYPYELNRPALPMTKGEILADKVLIDVMRKEGFESIYPPDLYNKLPNVAYSDMIGMIREGSEGGASLRIIYDSNTNYIGFFANSYK